MTVGARGWVAVGEHKTEIGEVRVGFRYRDGEVLSPEREAQSEDVEIPVAVIDLGDGEWLTLAELRVGGVMADRPQTETTQTDARIHLAWLIWCYEQGYTLAEDREILSNWLLDDPASLHPDDLRDRGGLLAMADEVLALLDTPPALCRCGHEEHLHDREAVPALCLTCGTADYCNGDHDHTEHCRQCGATGCCKHCAGVVTPPATTAGGRDAAALQRLRDLLDRTQADARANQHLARLSVREIREYVFPPASEGGA